MGLIKLPCSFIFALASAGAVMAFPDPIEGKATLDGETVGTGEGPNDHAHTYSGKEEIEVEYRIAVTTKDGKPVFDPAGSTVVFRSKKWKFETPRIPITGITGDPAKRKIDRITFDGPWYGLGDVVDKGARGSVKFPKKAGGKYGARIVAKYESHDGKTRSTYTTTTEPQKPSEPKQPPIKTKVDERRSLFFDASTRTLQIHDDYVVETPDPSDPLLGAAVHFGSYQFEGTNTALDLALFSSSDSRSLQVEGRDGMLHRADASLLFLDLARNLFYARTDDPLFCGVPPDSPFYDPELSSVASPFLAEAASLLDPGRPTFDADAGLLMTIHPDVDLGVATQGFTISAHTGATDYHFVSSVPEPGSLAGTLAGLAMLSRRRR